MIVDIEKNQEMNRIWIKIESVIGQIRSIDQQDIYYSEEWTQYEDMKIKENKG